jgi:UrcA family protein
MTRSGLTLLIALGLSASAVLADDVPAETLQKTVSYSELDMNRPAGAEHLYMKLNAAARQVCQPLNGGLVRQKFEYRSCVVETLARAVAEVNNALLTAAYDAHGGPSIAALRVAVK